MASNRSSSTRRARLPSATGCSARTQRTMQSLVGAEQLAQLWPPGLPGLWRGARRPLRRGRRVRATGGKLIAVNATGCLEVFSTPYPESSWQLPWLHSLFGNAPSVATGVAAALRAKGRTDVRVVGQGGDGGTVDIGFGCLSGMFERNDDVLYVCYDNEAYMNTGVQRSGATPPAARTANTSRSAASPATPSARARTSPHRDGPRDPVRRHGDRRRPARPGGEGQTCDGVRGARYLHVLVPCPLGWGSASPRHDPGRTACRARADCSRSSRPRRARSPPSRRSGATFRSRSTCGCRSGSPTCSASPARPTSSRIQAIADRNIEQYGLLDERGGRE